MSIGILHLLGILITLVIIISVGIYSGSRVHEAQDFSNGGSSAGAWIVTGAILGALVGGQSTIGTSQLAFLYGLSAWWFTLGSGIGCLILFLVYAIPMRQTGKTTILSVISEEYGHTAEYLGSLLSSIGIIISIISNVISGCALLMTVLPISLPTAAVITVTLMMIYVIFGGVWGAGMGGVVKLILLYMLSLLGLAIVLKTTNGFGGLLAELDHTLLTTDLSHIYKLTDSAQIRHQYLNLLSRGASRDLGSGASLLLGVLSTQTYAQAIWSARNHTEARRGALLSACLAPPIGLCCLLIGIFMRNHCLLASEVVQLEALGSAIPAHMTIIESSTQVLPIFILEYMPSLLGGIAIGALLITVVGGGAGLSLGVSVILVENIFVKLSPGKFNGKNRLLLTRCTILAVLLSTALAAILSSRALINDLGFLSMGLRGAVIFIPFTCALFLKGRIDPKMIPISMILGPLTVLLGNALSLSIDPLFPGITVSGVCCLLGLRRKKNTAQKKA